MRIHHYLDLVAVASEILLLVAAVAGGTFVHVHHRLNLLSYCPNDSFLRSALTTLQKLNWNFGQGQSSNSPKLVMEQEVRLPNSYSDPSMSVQRNTIASADGAAAESTPLDLTYPRLTSVAYSNYLYQHLIGVGSGAFPIAAESYAAVSVIVAFVPIVSLVGDEVVP